MHVEALLVPNPHGTNALLYIFFTIPAPKTAPKEIKAVSNGPRKIYVTWKVRLHYQ